jgi:hypothetical protein
MEKFAEILAVGGKTNSLGRSAEVLEAVLADPGLLADLYGCLFADDAWVRMRAADCLEKVCREHPEWVGPFIDRIFDDLSASAQPSIQWHLAQIFAEVTLTESQKARAIDWLKKTLAASKVDWIVSVNAMKTLLSFYRSGAVSTSEITPLFEQQQQHSSNTVRKKASQFLGELANG